MARQSNGWSDRLVEVALRSSGWSSRTVAVSADLHDVGRVAVGSSACFGVDVLSVSSVDGDPGVVGDPGVDTWRVAVGSSAVVGTAVPSPSSDDDPKIS